MAVDPISVEIMRCALRATAGSDMFRQRTYKRIRLKNVPFTLRPAQGERGS